jgi:hypothetical protein
MRCHTARYNRWKNNINLHYLRFQQLLHGKHSVLPLDYVVKAVYEDNTC